MTELNTIRCDESGKIFINDKPVPHNLGMANWVWELFINNAKDGFEIVLVDEPHDKGPWARNGNPRFFDIEEEQAGFLLRENKYRGHCRSVKTAAKLSNDLGMEIPYLDVPVGEAPYNALIVWYSHGSWNIVTCDSPE